MMILLCVLRRNLSKNAEQSVGPFYRSIYIVYIDLCIYTYICIYIYIYKLMQTIVCEWIERWIDRQIDR